MRTNAIWAVIGLTCLITGCSNGSSTYSLLADSSTFTQNSAQYNTKIDILWVIDNSGSMATSQANLANNFPSFINRMVDNNYDFQIAVTTSDAFLARPEYTSFYNMGPPYYHGEAQAEIAHFRDGPGSTHSGFRVLTPSTPNLVSNFINNATQGINGYGDERSLQSFRTALESPLNAGFVRPDGFLAVIILTDEDDFSRDSTTATESYESSANLHPISSYVSFLDDLTSSTASQRNYSVNTISVNSQACLDSIFNGWQKIGVRVGQLADATGGVKGNLCGDFAQELDLISQSIVALSTQFYLGNKKPIPSTIQVWVNGTWVPEASQNPQTNGGWTYVSETNSLVFTGIYVPPQGAQISVSFDPESITF